MQAIRLSRFGAPDVLQPVELPVPVPSAGEALIRVRAAGVNYFEVLMRQDRYAVTPDLPMVPGVEAAGVVEAFGPGAAGPAPGTRVAAPLFAMGRAGGYADYVTAEAAALVPLPDGLSFEAGAALMVQGLTALHLLRRSPPQGKSILVNAAAGGVGSLLVQLARSAGARQVIAAGGSPEKLDLARFLGADAAVDYRSTGWVDQVLAATAGAGVDIAYDLVGGPQTAACLGALAPAGELVCAAMGRFELGKREIEALLGRNQSLKGFALLPLLTPGTLYADLGDLFVQAAAGALKVVIGGRFPLARAAEAHESLQSRRNVGKVVLVP
ncbi:NADPH:quinone oxidoreductase [Labrys okinawensis]|uniref:NADPH:quinone oxidoreductase n=1 Tax=Labrys okinawensis TaxID=346911 RepID=A0A2S9Q9X6_9HYPH|nr:zinc-binding dehydrogenase [Labrys okinawensis]PRH86141.1 NADPH:quinone oxidoreductase [Labrys okinawensis]